MKIYAVIDKASHHIGCGLYRTEIVGYGAYLTEGKAADAYDELTGRVPALADTLEIVQLAMAGDELMRRRVRRSIRRARSARAPRVHCSRQQGD